jgi:hypothetical protein
MKDSGIGARVRRKEAPILDEIEAERKHLERIQALSPAERTEFHQRLRKEEARNSLAVIIIFILMVAAISLSWQWWLPVLSKVKAGVMGGGS